MNKAGSLISNGQHLCEYSPFSNVFKWSGAGANWSTLANASGAPCVPSGALGLNGSVYAMDVEYSLCNGTLNGIWTAGSFTQAGGGSAWSLVIWTNDIATAQSPISYWAVPPTPTITLPANGAVLSPGPANVSVAASLAASGCSVAKTEFYENNVLLGSFASAPPYSFTWSGVPSGSHTIRAVCTDASGRIAVSNPVTFTVH